MAPRALIVTLFHLLFVPIVWAVLLYEAGRTRYDFSGIEGIWMAVDFLAAILLRILVTVELLCGLDVVFLRISSGYGRELALRAIGFIFKFRSKCTTIGTELLIFRRWLVSLKVWEDGSYWCFLALILIGYYELIAFFVLLFLRYLS